MSSMDSGLPEAPSGRRPLPESFRRLGLAERQQSLQESLQPGPQEWQAISPGEKLAELADVMVESAIGTLAVPLGVATGFLIDGEELDIPMAVEEPSVIAAATFAARLTRQGGGLHTWATEPVMAAQVFLEAVPEQREAAILAARTQIAAEVDAVQPGMKRRGGGFRELRLQRLAESGVLKVELAVDVRDAMGANALNTAAEAVAPLLERVSGGRALMSILSNAARERRAGARFSLPLPQLSRAVPAGTSVEDAAGRIVLASQVAQEDPERAVTHNKGIMNGISALALATANDTRAVEAAAHAWAAREGPVRGLSRYECRDGALEASLELPLALGTVGGAVAFHPASRLSLRLLGFPDGRRLARIAAALGLAQNFAALLALVTGGIQRGHMRLHARRLAYQAGAREGECTR
jgi:hydroxymethylglutaryl-CoA reductase